MTKNFNMEILKIGFIGGSISSAVGRTHFCSSQLDGKWRLVAGCFSRDEEQNLKTAKQYNIKKEHCYNNWLDLIKYEHKNLDAVAILSPSPMHCEMVCELLKRSIPIICEKPLACSVEELNIIKNLYDPKANFLAVTYNYSGYPMLRELKDIIEAKQLGKIKQMRLEMPQDSFVKTHTKENILAAPQPWRLTDSKIPTICLDLGVHLHHLLYFLSNSEPKTIMATFNNYSSYSNIVDDVDIWLKYKDKFSANIWMSKNVYGSRNQLKINIIGENGSAVWQQEKSEILTISNSNGSKLVIDRGSSNYSATDIRYDRMKVGHPSGYIEAFANIYYDIADSLKKWRIEKVINNKYVFGIEHASFGINLLDKACLSKKEGKWIEVNNK